MKQKPNETHEQYCQRILTRQRTRKRVRNFVTEIGKGIVLGCFMVGIVGLSCYVNAKANEPDEEFIPTSDIAECYYDEYNYLCFELSDVGNINDNPNNPSYEDIAREIGIKEKVYMICDVVDYETDTNGNTDLWCLMPNGDVEIFSITDAPEGKISEVCLVTTNQNDYKLYEVVAVR